MKKNNSFFSEFLQKVPDHINREMDLSFEIADRIHHVLKERNITQKQFAVMMEKRESEISRWLSGSHNFTLETISKISAILKTDIIQVPRESEKVKVPYTKSATCKVVNRKSSVTRIDQHLNYHSFSFSSLNKNSKNGQKFS